MKRIITKADLEEMRTSGYPRSTIAQAEDWLAIYQRADELIAQIESAFAGVALENGIGLWEARGIDDYCGQEELRKLRAKDEKLDWRRIPVDDLNNCYTALSFLDAQGLYFHLPAFLTAELRGEYTQDFIGCLIHDSLAAKEFRQLLTPEQRHVIIACVSFFGSLEHCDYAPEVISKAILRYST